MRIVIVGAGMIGVHIARELIDEKRDVVLIEKDPDLARIASNELDCMVVNEDGCRPEVLRKAGIADASWFLALTGSDEANIVSCGLVAAESAGVRTVARVENPFYSDLSADQRKALGLDVLINPAVETADTVARIVDEGFAEDVVPLHDGRLQLRYIEASMAPGFSGRTLGQIKATVGRDFIVAAAVRDGLFEIPSGDFLVGDGDRLYVLGTPADLDAFLGPVAGIRQAARRVLLVGATRICERLIERLLEKDRSRGAGLVRYLKGKARGRRLLTVLDSSREAGKRLTKAFQGVDVSQGDSSEEGILEQAGVAEADLVVCVTESQTFNILTAQLAKTLGAKKAIAITVNDRYKSLGSLLEVDALVSVKNAVAVSVLELIRRAHIRTIHGFFEDDVEIVELAVRNDSPATGRRLQDLSLPKGTLVAFVIKGEAIVVPTGSTVLDGGDIVAFIVRKNAITGLEQAFGGRFGD